MSERRRLKLADADAVASEIRKLRAGCIPAGNWSLPQTCWHLDQAIRFSMRPGPHQTVKNNVVQWAQLKAILISGRLPAGISAPERVVPTQQTPESAIDDFLGRLEELKNFKGEFAPHPLLGQIRHDEFVRLHLIHCAHHLSFLTPANRGQE